MIPVRAGFKWFSFFCSGIIILIISCAKDQTVPVFVASNSNYPPEISAIITNDCATAGCHNEQSKVAAGGLAMDTWAHLFEGGSGGSVVIPYRPDQSWVLFFTNTDTSRGPALKPTMPYNKPALSETQYSELQSWIAAGAPDANGNIAFSGDPNRHKFYVTDQGCDEVTVFDRATLLAMRYIHVGVAPQIETPHQIRISPDGQYWYVVFVNGSVLQKFRTSDDSLVGNINLGYALWSTIAITPDGKYGYVADWEADGKIAYVDLENLKVIQYYQGSNLFSYPHGAWLNHAGNTLYVTAQYGNFIYKLNVTDAKSPLINKVLLAPGQAMVTTPGTLDPHEVILSPDESKYFVTCMSSNEVRVMNTANDSLIDVVKVGVYPLEMSYSKKYPYLFVSCEEDPSFTGNSRVRGSIYVINYQTLQVVKVLQGDMFQPHGVFVDDDGGYVYITNRNVDPNGPAPHHVSNCGGRNGFMKIINLNADPNAMEFIPGYRTEVSVDPYSVAGR